MNKQSSNLPNFVVIILCLFFLVLGLIVKRIPLINFDGTLYAGDILSVSIAVLALIGAAHYIPKKVEKNMRHRDMKNQMLVGDIVVVIENLNDLLDAINNFHDEKKVVSSQDRAKLMLTTTEIGNDIQLLDEIMKGSHNELGFSRDVRALFYEKTKIALTENLYARKKLDANYVLEVNKSLQKLINTLKQIRYKIIS